DERTDVGVARVHAQVMPEELYARCGVQFQPFNTLYQLASEPAESLSTASAMLLLPDLLVYWLTGRRQAEVTNASTTGLLRRDHQWDLDLAESLGLPRRLFPELVAPGTPVGPVLPGVADEIGLSLGTQVIAVASHDTASAVAAVPAAGEGFAYVSSGTWSLIGLEQGSDGAPGGIRTRESRRANFTNEVGVDGTVRFLKNVTGMWLISESLRMWQLSGERVELAAVVLAAGRLPVGGPVIDPNDEAFTPPGDMPARIAAACRERGLPEPVTPPEVVRCILDSLAASYGDAIDTAGRLSGQPIDTVHVVGGGARNAVLNQLTARACGLPVLAGPVEATALGNALVQARALGALGPGLADLRSLVARTQEITRYDPGD
ncbi:MAG: rhamnulokinase, partial [Dermatophilaceae bacterium]